MKALQAASEGGNVGATVGIHFPTPPLAPVIKLCGICCEELAAGFIGLEGEVAGFPAVDGSVSVGPNIQILFGVGRSCGVQLLKGGLQLI